MSLESNTATGEVGLICRGDWVDVIHLKMSDLRIFLQLEVPVVHDEPYLTFPMSVNLLPLQFL